MGTYTRSDSPWWWLWLETAPPGAQKEKTAVRVGHTVTDRHDSKLKAEAVYRKRMDELAARIHRLPTARPTIRFEKYADTYKTDVIAHHKGAEREREILQVLVTAFGEELLHTIDADRVRQWMTTRSGPVSAVTVNREVDLLKSMLRDAVPKYLEASPIRGMKRLKRGRVPRRRLLSEKEERRLLKAAKADPQDYALIVLGIDTMVRLGDLLDLRRRDRHGTWIYFGDPKNDEPFEVPLSPRAARALDAIHGDADYYFAKFRRAEKPRDWRSSVRQRLERLCAAADVRFGKAADGITWHWATRRTGATRLLIKKRQPVPVVQRLGGWKTPDVLLEIYAEAQRDDLLRAVGRRPLPARSRSKRKSA